MNLLELTRRRFMQIGVGAGLSFDALARHLDHFQPPSSESDFTTSAWDPYWQLALQNAFQDHDLQAWPVVMRACMGWSHMEKEELQYLLGPDVQIRSCFHAGADTWCTVSFHPEALNAMPSSGLYPKMKGHLWGAPWRHFGLAGRSALTKTRPPGLPSESGWGPQNADASNSLLVIDHGFPLHHLRESGVSYLHHASHAMNRPESLSSAASHGAQVLSLLLGVRVHQTDLGQPLRYLLYELPDALTAGMPRGAVWPDVIDAVCWGIEKTHRGQDLNVLLSVSSTDGDRREQDFITLSAQALGTLAQSKGIQLKWIIAAGNAHQAGQNLRFVCEADAAASWYWQLPPQNAMASFLECWHDASLGAPDIFIKPPGQTWTDPLEHMTMASRTQRGRTQTVFRLPPTSSLGPEVKSTGHGAWGMRWGFKGRHSADLDVHLALMSAQNAGPNRQAWLTADPRSDSVAYQGVTLNGLVPHATDVWVAQVLSPDARSPMVLLTGRGN